jgi:hypothetical protein
MKYQKVELTFEILLFVGREECQDIYKLRERVEGLRSHQRALLLLYVPKSGTREVNFYSKIHIVQEIPFL